MNRSTKKCPTLNCDKLIKPTSRMFYCSNCRQVMASWAKRKMHDITRRAEALDKWRDRMTNLKLRRETRDRKEAA